ncbi:hypothetical protein XELAEV_18010989mg [Xenopus laevis]|uniref:Uncharacterized protein n=1 Tax=Xenopus laevis TaxID=8355 RepID=A0A974DVK6_XENLA|nr:hypothetical protein XELAEV_18010989mg [Xenopus laevis]
MVCPGSGCSAWLYGGRSWGCCSVGVPSMRAPSSVWQTFGEFCPAQRNRQSLRCSCGPGEGAYRIPGGIFLLG